MFVQKDATYHELRKGSLHIINNRLLVMEKFLLLHQKLTVKIQKNSTDLRMLKLNIARFQQPGNAYIPACKIVS
jgi:hypothetical protein